MTTSLPQNQLKEFNFYDYVDSLFNRLPQALKTDNMYNDIAHQVNGIIMGLIGDYMNHEDLEMIMRRSQEPGIGLDDLIVDHINHNPDVVDVILEELGTFEKTFLAFCQL